MPPARAAQREEAGRSCLSMCFRSAQRVKASSPRVSSIIGSEAAHQTVWVQLTAAGRGLHCSMIVPFCCHYLPGPGRPGLIPSRISRTATTPTTKFKSYKMYRSRRSSSILVWHNLYNLFPYTWSPEHFRYNLYDSLLRLGIYSPGNQCKIMPHC